MGPALDIRQKFKKEMNWDSKLRKRVAAIGENCPMSRTGPIVIHIKCIRRNDGLCIAHIHIIWFVNG